MSKERGERGSLTPRNNNCKREENPLYLYTAVATHGTGVALGRGCRSAWSRNKKHPGGKEIGKRGGKIIQTAPLGSRSSRQVERQEGGGQADGRTR